MSTTNWSSNLPSDTSVADFMIASPNFESNNPSSIFVSAAASLTIDIASIKDREKRRSLIGKLSTALIVLAP